MSRLGSDQLRDAAEQFQRSAASFSVGLNQLKELFNSIGGQIGGLVRLYNPSAFNQFKLAVDNAQAALGRILLPTLQQFTVVVQGIGAGLASLGPQAQTLVRGLVAAGVSMAVAAAAAYALSAAVNAATGGIPAILGLVAGGLTGLGLALKDLKGVQDTVNAVMRPLVGLFNTLARTVAQVFAAVQPALTGFTGVFARAIESVAGVVTAATPGLVNLATKFTTILGQLAQHFAGVAPFALQLATTLIELGQAVVGVQMDVLSTALSALLPIGRLFAAVLSGVAGVLAPLIRVGLIPLQTVLALLAPAARLVAVALEPVVAFVDEFGSILGDLADLLADTLAQLPALLSDVLPLFDGVVQGFVSAMRQVVEAIRFAADVVRDLLGLPERSRGGIRPEDDTFNPKKPELAVRQTNISSVQEFLNQARKSAFSIGGEGQKPEARTANATERTAKATEAALGKFDEVRSGLEAVVERIANIAGTAAGVAAAPARAGVDLFQKALTLGTN